MPITKKREAPGLALFMTLIGLLMFNGCMPPGPRALLQGERFLHETNYTAAIEKLESAAQLLPKDARAWNYLGLAYHGAGRLNEAGKVYRQALSLDRNLVVVHYNLGCLYLDQTNAPAAISELTSYTSLQPNIADGWLKLGTAQLRARQSDAAEKSLRLALKFNAHLPDAWNCLGLIQMQRRHYQEAAQQFTAALHEQPDYAPALLNLAIVSYEHLNNHAFALQKFREYVALRPAPPDSKEVQELAGQIDLELHPVARPLAKNPPQVAELSKPAATTPTTNKSAPMAASDKTTPVANLQPAVTAPDLARTSAPPAKTEVVRLTDEGPAKPVSNAARNTAVAGNSNLSKRIEKSDVVANAVNNGRPAPPPPAEPRYKYHSPAVPMPGNREEAERLLAQGVSAQEQYRLASAIEDYLKATRADPSFFNAWYNLGVAEYDTGDLPQSLLAYEYALAINPDSIKARYNFAVAAQKAGYPRDAANELEKLLAVSPDESRAHFLLANLYARQLGEPARAREHYLRVLELEPHHPQATAIRFWLEANR